MIEKMKRQKKNAEDDLEEKREDNNETRSKEKFIIIVFAAICFVYGTNFYKSSWYITVRDIEIFRIAVSGVNSLGGALGYLGYQLSDFIREQWIDDEKINRGVKVVIYIFALSCSFLLGVGNQESIDFQKRVEEALERPVRGEEINSLCEDAERIDSDMISFNSTVGWEMDVYYELSINEVKKENIFDKILHFDRVLYGKFVGVDEILESIEISYRVYVEENKVSVVDRLVSYGDKQLYINNSNIEQGEIRYKLLNEEEWSEWISVDELKDGKMDINQEIEMLNWKLGDREDAFVVVNDKAEIIFCSLGEEYALEKNILRELLDEAEIDKEIDFEKCEVRFRVEEDVKGDREYFQDRQRLDLEELKVKMGDKIAVEFYIEDNSEGIYFIEQLGNKKGVQRFYLNTIDERQTDNAAIKMELYMYERK